MTTFDDLERRNCPCARLLDPFNADPIPAVVCETVLAFTARRWAEEWWRRLGWTIALNRGGALLRPFPFPFPDPFVALQDEGIRALTALVEEWSLEGESLLSEWPFHFEGGLLAWAIRQWVQEPPNLTLANLLSNDPSWSWQVELVRRNLARRAQELDDWAMGETEDDVDVVADRPQRVPPLVGRGPTSYPLFPDDIFENLAHCHLPATPATVGYAYAVAAGDDGRGLPARIRRLILRDMDGRPLPARGLLVTTFVYFGPAEISGGPRSVPHPGTGEQLIPVRPSVPEVRITGDLELATGPLLDQAQQVALEHRAFLRTTGQYTLTKTSNVRRAQPSSYDAPVVDYDRLDYVEEAVRGLDEAVRLLKPLAPSSSLHEDQFDDYLESIYRRVSERRRRKDRPRTPPKGWRKEVKRIIRERLKS